MCGICGVMHFHEGPPSEGLIRRMTEVLHHRGPDGTGVYCSGQGQGKRDKGYAGVGLGHTRLKVIDLSEAASQPMSNAEGTVWIVFNGEIYNYRELGSRLRRAGYRFRSQSDTEVVLHLYEEKGERCVEELDGMFAFAIWDEKKQQLFLARDRPGKKPLFYYKDERLFAFASEIKALLQHPAIAAEINLSAVPAYFLYGYVPTPETFYKNIYKLPPAHTLTVDLSGKMEVRPYWDLQFPIDSRRSAVSGRRLNDQEAAVRVRELVTEAVRKRLVADVPVGAFLSGGIDSSIAVRVMSQLLGQPIKTFSIGFVGDKAFDETHYARLVARHFHTEHTEFIVEPHAIDLIERLIWHHDGPFGDSSAIPT